MMKNNKKAKLLALIPIMFFSVSGGPYGLEEIVVSVGPIYTLMLVLLIPVIWTIPECLVVAELSSNYPIQGGYYRWVYMGLGKFWGFIEGWLSILYTLIDLSLYPVLFTAYLKFFLPELDFWQMYLVQLLIIWSSAILNILGIRVVGYALGLFSLFILLSFLFFLFSGLNYLSFDFSSLLNSNQKFVTGNFLFGLSLAFWNFIGWDNSSTVMDEIHNPKKNYRKAMFVTIPIIIFFYFLPLLVGLSINTNWGEWKFGEFSYIAQAMNQPVLATILSFGGMVMCLGLFNSMLLSSTRVFSTMADDRMLPDLFSKIHGGFNTPYIAIIFSALLYSVLVLVNFYHLIVYDVFLYLIAIALEAIALIMLRKKNGKEHNDFKIPFGTLGMYVVIGMILFCVGVVTISNFIFLPSSLSGTFISILLVLSSLPAYYIFGYKSKKVEVLVVK